jgi:hypothetical protein
MKKIILLACCCYSLTAFSQTGNVGIGTTLPKARLHVTDSAVLFTGPATLPATTPFYPPVSGAGSRMMWYPQKAAFRAGFVEGTQWDKDSIGRYSIALGLNTMAKGDWSVSLGAYTKATGYNSTSLGDGSIASGANSTSMGAITHAIGNASTSMGANTAASGYTSTSMGEYTKALEYASTSMGYFTTASGFFSTSMGSFTVASGDNSASMGTNTTARSSWSLVIGKYNDTTNTASVFEIGNGSSDNARNNALTVLMNGNIGLGITSPNAPLQFANTIANRKLVLYDANNNDHQYSGIGINNDAVRYQVAGTAADHAFYVGTSSTTSTELFRIKGTGNIGIGNNNPLATLALNNGFGNKIALYTTSATQQYGFGVQSGLFQMYGDASVADIAFGTGSSTSFTERMRIKGTGNVGIGTSTPSQALQVIGNIIASGTITPSDARYKKNILLIDHPLQKLQQLNGVTYNYRNDEFPDMKFTDVTQVGLIAQDVEKVFPQLVFADDKGYKAVDYVKLIPLLIESMKEQQKQIDEQRKMIQQLLNK